MQGAGRVDEGCEDLECGTHEGRRRAGAGSSVGVGNDRKQAQVLRARINEERILNRIDSNRLLFYESIRFGGKNTSLGSIGKPCIVLEIL